MPNKDLLSYLFQESFKTLSRSEIILLESVIFIRVIDNLMEMLIRKYKDYQKILKNELIREDEIMDFNFLRMLICDILSTEEYTLEGIANVIRMPFDAVFEIASGLNTNPSLMLATKIIKLHSDLRRDLYEALIRKMLDNK